MRKINKKEINILLTPHQHSLVAKLKETGVNLSSISRLAIRKFGDTDFEVTSDEGAKTKRAVIYLEADDVQKLESISARKAISKSEALRKLLSTYLEANEAALNQLF